MMLAMPILVQCKRVNLQWCKRSPLNPQKHLPTAKRLFSSRCSVRNIASPIYLKHGQNFSKSTILTVQVDSYALYNTCSQNLLSRCYTQCFTFPRTHLLFLLSIFHVSDSTCSLTLFLRLHIHLPLSLPLHFTFKKKNKNKF